jgi:YfiR/HmsC-like
MPDSFFRLRLLFMNRKLTRLLIAASLIANEKTFAQSPDWGRLQANYLVYFAELTEWPGPLPMTICAQGNGAVAHYLPMQEGRVVKGEMLKVLVGETIRMEQCRILFLENTPSLNANLLRQARTHHVLLVGNQDNFARQGGMVQFKQAEKRSGLTLNLNAMQRARLKMSSKVLRMAEVLP